MWSEPGKDLVRLIASKAEGNSDYLLLPFWVVVDWVDVFFYLGCSIDMEARLGTLLKTVLVPVLLDTSIIRIRRRKDMLRWWAARPSKSTFATLLYACYCRPHKSSSTEAALVRSFYYAGTGTE